MNQARILVRGFAVSKKRVDVGSVAIIIATTCTVLLAKTGHRKTLVVLAVGGVARIVVVIWVMEVVRIGTVEP